MASVSAMTTGNTFVDLDKQEARNAILEEAAKVVEASPDLAAAAKAIRALRNG